MKRKPFNQVIQVHHITYEPPRTVLVRQTEHYILSVMQRMKVPTKGFLSALRQYIRDNKDKAVSGGKIRKGEKL